MLTNEYVITSSASRDVAATVDAVFNSANVSLNGLFEFVVIGCADVLRAVAVLNVGAGAYSSASDAIANEPSGFATLISKRSSNEPVFALLIIAVVTVNVIDVLFTKVLVGVRSPELSEGTNTTLVLLRKFVPVIVITAVVES